MASPIVILVAPQMAENIGAVARVMANLGASILRLVAPRDGWPNEAALPMAAGADHIVKQAALYQTLPEALADIHYSIALSARPRYLSKPFYPLREWEAHVPPMAESQQWALIFGPERAGLTNEDLSHAQSICAIETNPDFPSLNLAQAVGVALYTMTPTARHSVTASMPLEAATQAEIHYFLTYMLQQLRETSYFSVAEKQAGMEQTIRTMFTNRSFSSQEIRTLFGLIRALSQQE